MRSDQYHDTGKDFSRLQVTCACVRARKTKQNYLNKWMKSDTCAISKSVTFCARSHLGSRHLESRSTQLCEIFEILTDNSNFRTFYRRERSINANFAIFCTWFKVFATWEKNWYPVSVISTKMALRTNLHAPEFYCKAFFVTAVCSKGKQHYY